MASTPNAHRIWPHLYQLRDPKHPKVLCKIPTIPTTEPAGVSNWHLLALGILPMEEVTRFLRTTLDAKPGVVFDDLFERISKPLPDWWIKPALAVQLIPDDLIGYDLVGYGVEELCRLQQITLLGHYLHEGVLTVPMNPAVTLFEQWIGKEIYGQN